MKKFTLARTNVLVCLIIILGFSITSVISYHSNMGIFKQDVERVANLTSEAIYYKIESIFTMPLNVSLTMANDSLLKEFLTDENLRKNDEAFMQGMRNYLSDYHEKYAYDSIFLASTQSKRYYHFNGIDRVLQTGDPENTWYYNFLSSNEDYALNIDNDQASNNEITVFVNCKITSRTGETLGIVGVGFRVNTLQQLLQRYETKFGVSISLVDASGAVELSTSHSAYERVTLFEPNSNLEKKFQAFASKMGVESFWYSSPHAGGYIVSRYVPSLKWHLIVESDTSALNQQLTSQFMRGILVIIGIISIVLLVITSVIHKYNAQIIALTISREKNHRSLFRQATEQIYDNIYEFDITHNCPVGENTNAFLKSLDIPDNSPYEAILEYLTKTHIKEEFRPTFITTFSSKNVLLAYHEGKDCLTHEFMSTMDSINYFWMRVTVSIFFWSDDQSVRIFFYRQNIDDQKQHEEQLFEKVQRDSLTGLYNKVATHEHIREMLHKKDAAMYAFIIFDVDFFKSVNDNFGHAMGDTVIASFANKIKEQFRDEDIVGRIGGDEFAVFLPVPHRQWAEKKAKELVLALQMQCTSDLKECSISASIGIALYPEAGTDFETLYKNADFALYETKKRGKNGFTII